MGSMWSTADDSNETKDYNNKHALLHHELLNKPHQCKIITTKHDLVLDVESTTFEPTLTKSLYELSQDSLKHHQIITDMGNSYYIISKMYNKKEGDLGNIIGTYCYIGTKKLRYLCVHSEYEDARTCHLYLVAHLKSDARLSGSDSFMGLSVDACPKNAWMTKK